MTLFLTGAAGMPDFAVQIIDIIVFILAFAFILFLAYFTIRFMGRARRGGRNSANVKIIEAIGVGFQNTVQLVAAGDKIFLIGVSRGGITLIGEVNPESVNIENKTVQGAPFEKYLSRFFNKNADKRDENGDDDR